MNTTIKKELKRIIVVNKKPMGANNSYRKCIVVTVLPCGESPPHKNAHKEKKWNRGESSSNFRVQQARFQKRKRLFALGGACAFSTEKKWAVVYGMCLR